MTAAKTLQKLTELTPTPLDPSATPPAHIMRLSPHRGRREYGPVDTVVIHATAGSSRAGAINHFLNPQSKASAHLVIPDTDRPGEPTQTTRMVPDEEKAWHVRRSVHFPKDDKNDINSRSLGIELVNTVQENDPFSAWQV